MANLILRDKGGLVPASSAHVASILGTGQLLPFFLKSLGLFLTMVPYQVPNFTHFLQIGTCHRADLF